MSQVLGYARERSMSLLLALFLALFLALPFGTFSGSGFSSSGF
jgi:hypothetical protein